MINLSVIHAQVPCQSSLYHYNFGICTAEASNKLDFTWIRVQKLDTAWKEMASVGATMESLTQPGDTKKVRGAGRESKLPKDGPKALRKEVKG